MLREFCGFRFIGPRLGEANHVKQILPAEAHTVPGAQLSRQCRDNLLAIGGPFLAENFLPDSGAHFPVHQHQFRVNCPGNTLPCRIDELGEIAQELRDAGRSQGGFGRWLSIFHIWATSRWVTGRRHRSDRRLTPSMP
jgi:hypothetical protein